MISIREIERKYKSLMHEVKTDHHYKIDLENRANVYTCDKGHTTKTIDIDPGVTPYFHSCFVCGRLAKSSFYHDTLKDEKPVEEWYRPTLEECKKLRRKPAELEHVFSGGLLSRKFKPNEI